MTAPGWRLSGKPKVNDEWSTPRSFFDMLNREFAFALDAACRSTNCLAPNGIMRDRGEDGLSAGWFARSRGGSVWCNPPYSETGDWIRKCADESAEGCVVVALVPADVSTSWWRVIRDRASEVRFVESRLTFGDHRSFKSRTPSAAVVFTPQGGPPTHSYIPAWRDATMPLPLATP